MLKLIKKGNQAGVTLLETILVMSLIAIIMVGGLNLYRSASDSAKSTDAMRNLVSLATNIKALYGSQYNFAGLSNSVVIDAGLVPPGMKNDGASSILNTFGGSVQITATTAITSMAVGAAGSSGALERTYVAGETFQVVYPSVPQAVCYKLVTTDLGQIGGPLTPSQTASVCGSGSTNNLRFSFYK